MNTVSLFITIMKDKWKAILLWSLASLWVKDLGIPPQCQETSLGLNLKSDLLFHFASSPIFYCVLISETVACAPHQHGIWTTYKLVLAVALCWKGAGSSSESSLYSINPEQLILFALMSWCGYLLLYSFSDLILWTCWFDCNCSLSFVHCIIPSIIV